MFCPCQWWVSKKIGQSWVGGVSSIQLLVILWIFLQCEAPKYCLSYWSVSCICVNVRQSRPVSNNDRSGSPTRQPSRVPVDSTYINYEEEDDYMDEAFAPSDGLEPSDTGYWSGRSCPTRCMSLYDFQVGGATCLSVIIFLLPLFWAAAVFNYRMWWVIVKD